MCIAEGVIEPPNEIKRNGGRTGLKVKTVVLD